MQIDQSPAAIENARQKWYLSAPSGYVAVGVAFIDGAPMPRWLVVKNKATGVHMLTDGKVLRSFDARLLNKADAQYDTIVLSAPSGTKARWVHRSQQVGMPLSSWIIKHIDTHNMTHQTTSAQAQSLKHLFDKIKERGGHAALDFKDGELTLQCTKPSKDPDSWGKGSVGQPFGDDWIRLAQC